MVVKPQSASTYEALGASASKAGLHAKLSQAGIAGSGGLFSQVNADLAGSGDFLSFLHCDGAGTKSIIAYLCYRETGGRDAFAGLAQDALVMNLDDIFCIGIPEGLLLGNNIARNARLIDDEIIGVLVQSYKELIDKLNTLGIPIELAGGETADCGDIVRTLVVDAVITGRIRKDRLINAGNIQPGDIIIGLSSTGRASYEKAPNSGISSNGLTLARHVLLDRRYYSSFPEIADPGLSCTHAYNGPYRVLDSPPELEMSIGDALLSPTRTYAPLLADVYRKLGAEIHGVIHLTGGGHTKVLRFGRGNLYIKDNLFAAPPLFKLIQRHGEISWQEMYQVFNMGQRMEIYTAAANLDTIIDLARNFDIEAKQVGRVEKLAGDTTENKLRLETEYGCFNY